jgi:uncharacterized protein (DUF4415 family)
MVGHRYWGARWQDRATIARRTCFVRRSIRPSTWGIRWCGWPFLSRDLRSRTWQELRRRLSAPKSGTDWRRLGKRTEAEILAGIGEDPDARATDEAFWKGARVVMPKKKAITIRLDGDVLAWFRRSGQRYQTRINVVLRS